ncbi:MAG TPA: radical SAM family heme chaperone HemW [Gaiellales bacterium]|nr:radical SAM family heme chaperone HemW [Gaiellales bacterium]
MTAPRHLYVHVPFCGHRCGYCDFVTVTGNERLHGRYVDALLAELAPAQVEPDTVFVGGGTPSLLNDELLARLLAGLPPVRELTIECNPETITPAKAQVLVEGGVNRVSLGAQSFRPRLLGVLDRRAAPASVRAAVSTLRRAGVQNLNLDLMFGVPGQTADDLRRDVEDALVLEPEHISYYELEAKPGTRFAHSHGAELARQAEAMEDYYELVVDTLRDAGFRWYETANFCRPGHLSEHNLGYWLGHDYLGIGIGAVSTLGLERRRNLPSLPRYLEAVETGRRPAADVELLTAGERALERLMLGLRLDRPLPLNGDRPLLDPAAVERLSRDGMIVDDGEALQLSERGRFLADEVVASILR